MESVRAIAEAVLYEGYLLYPYTRTAMKNQQRWNFGGVYPLHYSEATGGDDPWLMQTQCLVLGDSHTEIEVTVRFLQVVQRRVLAPDGGAEGAAHDVEELWVGDTVYRPWEEAIEREVSAASGLRLDELATQGAQAAVEIPAGSDDEPLDGPDGTPAGLLRREWECISGRIELKLEPLSPEPGGWTLYRLTVTIVNTTPWDVHAGLPRSLAVRHSMISTHTVLQVRDGDFISLLEPEERYRAAAEACANIKTWPVLVGNEGERHTILSSPIILYDYPRVSPQSKGMYYDATEIDELLALSVLTLTDEEKQELRESDPRGREILERTEALTPAELMDLHGSVRALQTLRREE